MEKRRLDVALSGTMLVVVLAGIVLDGAGVEGTWVTGLRVLGWLLIAIFVGRTIRRYVRTGRF